MADAVEAFGQDVLQEPADELIRFQRHRFPAGLAVPIVFVAEGDATLIERDEAAV